MASTSIGKCGIFFGDCGCLQSGFCLRQVHQFFASHLWHGVRRFDYTSFPPLAFHAYDDCTDSGYGLSLPTRYLRDTNASRYTWSLPSLGMDADFTVTTTINYNRYTGSQSTSSNTVIVSGGSESVSGTINYPGWDWANASVAYNIVSDTEYVVTQTVPDWIYPERTLTIATTRTLSVTHSIDDFLSDCATLYASVTLDDLESDYTAESADRSVTASYTAAGTINKTWATVTYPIGVYGMNLEASNYVLSRDQSGYRITTWEGEKGLAIYEECTDSWDKEVVTYGPIDGCDGSRDGESRTPIPAGTPGDLLGVDAELYTAKVIDYRA